MKLIKEVSDMLGTNEVYLVGGSVRDILLSKIPKDYDFCTSLLPDEIEVKIREAGRKPYLIGKRFGTVGCKFLIDDQWELVEITTFRNEQYTYGSRKPVVTFSAHLQEDLMRRDFTINAMAINNKGKLFDFYDGKQDLDNEIIRCVVNPKQRFKEDPLRILRAVRFATVLGFEIELETLEYIAKMKYELFNVSKERWVIELDKILSSDNVAIGLRYLAITKLINVIIPELSLQINYDQNNPHHSKFLFDHTIDVVAGIPKEELDLRWVGLLHDIGKPFTRTENPKGHSNYISHDLLGAEMSLKISSYLKFSNQRTDYIYNTIKTHMESDSPLKQYDDNAK